jgi:hypothetical protein
MSTDALTPALLDAWGVAPSALGETSPVPGAERDVGTGAKVASLALGVVTSLRAALGDVSFVETAVPAAQSIGALIAMSEFRDVVKVTLGGGDSVRVLASGDIDERRFFVDDRDPSTVCVFVKDGPIAVLRSDGSGVIVVATGREPDLTVVVGRPHVIQELAAIVAPLVEWCAACGDPWLVQQVGRRARMSTRWQIAVGAAMIARHAEPGSIDTIEELLRPATAALVARRWFGALSAVELATIQDLGVAEIESLTDLVFDLRQSPTAYSRTWRRSVLRLCHGRDDVQGVRSLLEERGAAVELSSAIDVLDDLGEEWAAMVPAHIAIDDERLRRVASEDPCAWWGRLARLPDE